MAGPIKRVTSTDVAVEAGVSRATVSFVLNDRADQTIPEQTRQRVLEAARRLGYRPHSPAKALRFGRTDLVLLALPEWQLSPHLVQYVEGLHAGLATHGLTLVTHLGTAPGEPLPDVCAAVAAAVVIGLGAFDEGLTAELYAAGAQVVISSGRNEGVGLQVPLGRRQAEHLLALGHRRLGYAMPAAASLEAIARGRLAGVGAACTDAGLGEPVSATVDLESGSARTAVDRWRAAGVTGVCAYSDEVGLAVLAGLRQRGLRAPGDLAVIGVDDLPVSRFSDPPLSTLRIDSREMGRATGAAVAAALDGTPYRPVGGADLHLHVVPRASTSGPPPVPPRVLFSAPG